MKCECESEGGRGGGGGLEGGVLLIAAVGVELDLDEISDPESVAHPDRKVLEVMDRPALLDDLELVPPVGHE